MSQRRRPRRRLHFCFAARASGRVGGGRVRGVARALAHRTAREARSAYYVAGARACGFALAPPEAQASEAARRAILAFKPPINKACAHAAVLQLPVMPFACSFIFYERHSRFENVNYDDKTRDGVKRRVSALSSAGMRRREGTPANIRAL